MLQKPASAAFCLTHFQLYKSRDGRTATWRLEDDLKIIKKDLCKKVYEKCFREIVLPCGVTKDKIQYIIDAFLESITEELLEGNTIELRGLGTFERTLQKARYYAINPKTGKEVETKSYYKANFHPGKKLKEQMKQIPVPKVKYQNHQNLS